MFLLIYIIWNGSIKSVDAELTFEVPRMIILNHSRMTKKTQPQTNKPQNKTFTSQQGTYFIAWNDIKIILKLSDYLLLFW
jgi:hypothetical protein